MSLMQNLPQNDFNKIIISGIVFVFGVIGIFKIIFILPSRINHNDFAHYYISSRMLIEKNSIYQMELKEAFDKYGFIYSDKIPRPTNPPLLIWLYCAFAWMSPFWAYWNWVMFQTISCIVILWLMKHILSDYLFKNIWHLTCGGFFISSGLFFNFYYAQVQLPLLALILGAYVLDKQQKPLLAITLVIWAGMIKLYPMVFLPWFIIKASTTPQKLFLNIFYSIISIIFIILITGPRLWLDFIVYGMSIIRDMSSNTKGVYSIPSLIINSVYSFYNFEPPYRVKKFIVPIGELAGLGFILLIYTFIFKANDKPDIIFALLSIASIISGIICWPHYLVFLVFPLSLAFCVLDLQTPSKRILLMALLAILLTGGLELDLLPKVIYNPFQVLLYHLPTIAMLILSLLFLKKLVREEAGVLIR